MAGNPGDSSLTAFRKLTRIFFPPESLVEGRVRLSPTQSGHVVRVLRKTVGDQVGALDGTGNAWIAEIIAAEKTAAIIELKDPVPNPEGELRRVELAIAALKGEKLDLALRMGTELGVSAFHIVPTQRAVSRLEAGNAAKAARLRGVTVAAAEQCGAFTLPELNIYDSLQDFFLNIKLPQRYIAWEEETAQTAQPLINSSDSCILASGPEGGFSEDEVQLFIEQGFCPITLGHRVLRAETAPIVLASLALTSGFGQG